MSSETFINSSTLDYTSCTLTNLGEHSNNLFHINVICDKIISYANYIIISFIIYFINIFHICYNFLLFYSSLLLWSPSFIWLVLLLLLLPFIFPYCVAAGLWKPLPLPECMTVQITLRIPIFHDPTTMAH